VQAGSSRTLKRMVREYTRERYLEQIGWVREACPEISLSTDIIVGYPGETDAEFNDLMGFVRDLQFDRVGVFKYSHEENTPSADQPNPVPEEVKDARYNALMEMQQGISLARNQALVGKTLQVLVEGEGDGLSIARSYRDAPEIDGYVIIDGEVPAGEMLPVRITGAMNYDLTATVDMGGPLVIQPGVVYGEGAISLSSIQ